MDTDSNVIVDFAPRWPLGLPAGGWPARRCRAAAQDKFIVMASTTSTEQSGLFGHLLPAFKEASGIDVRVVALGTGQALDMGRRGDADVVFVHDQAAEEKFVAEGFGLKRLPVMYNDFVLIGPKADPAGVKGTGHRRGADEARRAGGRPSSRAATRAARMPPSCATGRPPASTSPPPSPRGYKDCGCGMGPALNMAASTNAYVLADRGTWLASRTAATWRSWSRATSGLFNQYGVIVVNPAKHPHVKRRWRRPFADWVVSPAGQATIAGYKIGGEQLFFPNARM